MKDKKINIRLLIIIILIISLAIFFTTIINNNNRYKEINKNIYDLKETTQEISLLTITYDGSTENSDDLKYLYKRSELLMQLLDITFDKLEKNIFSNKQTIFVLKSNYNNAKNEYYIYKNRGE